MRVYLLRGVMIFGSYREMMASMRELHCEEWPTRWLQPQVLSMASRLAVSCLLHSTTTAITSNLTWSSNACSTNSPPWLRATHCLCSMHEQSCKDDILKADQPYYVEVWQHYESVAQWAWISDTNLNWGLTVTFSLIVLHGDLYVCTILHFTSTSVPVYIILPSRCIMMI